MTQEMLAAETELSRASIANIERGRQNVGLHHLYSIAKALKVTRVQDLLPSLEIAAEKREEQTMMLTNEVISEKSMVEVELLVRNALKKNDRQGSGR